MPDQVVRTHRLEVKGRNITPEDIDGKLAATQAAAVADVTGTADVTYSSNEVTLINDTKTQLNALLASLRAAGIINT